jgi:hypothetical protein
MGFVLVGVGPCWRRDQLGTFRAEMVETAPKLAPVSVC